MENANKKPAIISFVIDKSDPTNPGLNKFIETQTIGGFEWEIRVLKNQLINGKWLTMEFLVICNENCKDKLWLAQAGIYIITKNSNSFGSEKLNKYTQYFSNENTSAQVECTLSYDINQENEQIVKIGIEMLRSLPSLMEFDSYLEITYYEVQENDRNVEKNEVITVNKYALASFSNYFRNLLFGNWAERHQQQESKLYTIKEEADFDIDLFKKVIYASLTMGWMMDNELFESIFLDGCTGNDMKYKMAVKMLKLSVKYDFPMIQNCCEEYFCSQLKLKDFSKMELVEVADNLGLQKLKGRILASINAVDFSLDYGKNFQIQTRLGKRTQDELISHIENSAKRMRFGFDPYEDDEDDYDDDFGFGGIGWH